LFLAIDSSPDCMHDFSFQSLSTACLTQNKPVNC
jgi:hypothetical protein